MFAVRVLDCTERARLKCNHMCATSFIHLQNSIRNVAYPADLQSLWIIMTIVAALHFSGKAPYDLADRILSWLPG